MWIVLRLLKRDIRPGTAFLAYVMLYSVGRFSLEFLRADSLMVFGLKAAQVTSLIFFALAGWLLYRRVRVTRLVEN